MIGSAALDEEAVRRVKESLEAKSNSVDRFQVEDSSVIRIIRDACIGTLERMPTSEADDLHELGVAEAGRKLDALHFRLGQKQRLRCD